MALKVFLGVFAAIGATLFLLFATLSIAWWAGDGGDSGTRFFAMWAVIVALVTTVVVAGGRAWGKRQASTG